MAKSPQTGKPEARQFPRFELYATVSLTRGDAAIVLPARNISLGGLYLAADGKRLNQFRIGETIEIALFDPMNESVPTLHTSAKVVRNEGQGLGLAWATTDPIVARAVASLLERLNPLGRRTV